MADEWRVEMFVEGHGGPRHVAEAARERAVAREARKQLGEGIRVSLDRDRLFAYAGSREEAEAARDALVALAAEHSLTATAELARWHPIEERWESPDVTVPEGGVDAQRERARRDAAEDAESAAWGYPEWEVRIEMAKHRDAVELADRLKAEGLGVARRHNDVRVGAADEDKAKALAERLKGELPEGTSIVAQGSEALAWAQLHKYSWLGGLGQ
jgi:hypothetical protein